jgi:hypothetical protein
MVNSFDGHGYVGGTPFLIYYDGTATVKSRKDD